MAKTTGYKERDREATEERLLATVGEMVRNEGFEKLGINAVATHADVSKILIYRYFGSLEGLLAAYIRRHDFWINFPVELPAAEQLPAYLKAMFRAQVTQLRSDPVLRRLCRWELSSQNKMVIRLREQREKAGLERVRQVARITKRSETQVASVATLLSAALTYLTMLGELCPAYNGIPLDTDQGWEQIASGIDTLVDKWFLAGN